MRSTEIQQVPARTHSGCGLHDGLRCPGIQQGQHAIDQRRGALDQRQSWREFGGIRSIEMTKFRDACRVCDS